jgi:hypothetical protein
MAIFNVEYADGTSKVEEQSDCSTVEQFMNCRFGSADTSKVKVTIVGEEAPAPKKTAKK